MQRTRGGERAAAGLLALCLVSGQARAEDEDDGDDNYYADPELGEVARAPTSIPGPLTVYGGIRLGLGGSVDYDPDATDDLSTTYGLQAGADYVLMPFFAVGGELRMAAFNTDIYDGQGLDRSLLFDFVVRPRGRYAFAGTPFEVYGTLPFGLSVPSISEDWSAEGDAGFTFGVGAGANYFVSDKLGFCGELLYLKHWVGWNSNIVGGSAGPTDYDVSLGQLNVVANVIYAL